MVLYMYSMFVLLECVCEPTLSHQTVSIKPFQKCGPYMPTAVLIRATPQRPYIYIRTPHVWPFTNGAVAQKGAR